MVKVDDTKTSIPTEEIELVTQEFKRVRSKKDKKIQGKVKETSASKLIGWFCCCYCWQRYKF